KRSSRFRSASRFRSSLGPAPSANLSSVTQGSAARCRIIQVIAGMQPGAGALQRSSSEGAGDRKPSNRPFGTAGEIRVGKRSTARAKRAAAVARQGRLSQPKQPAQDRKPSARPPMTIGIILLLLAVVAVFGWQIHRRAQVLPTAAAGQVGAADEREA